MSLPSKIWLVDMVLESLPSLSSLLGVTLALPAPRGVTALMKFFEPAWANTVAALLRRIFV